MDTVKKKGRPFGTTKAVTRDKEVKIRMTDVEMGEWKAKAAQAGHKTVAGWIRNLAAA